MQKRSSSLVFCFALITAAGCIDASGAPELDEDAISAAELALEEPEPSESEPAESELAGAELAGTDWGSEEWVCEGWYSPKFQYCLTRCTHHINLHPVGSEHEIPYGQCHERADRYCRDRGSWVNDVCWGSYR